MPARTVVTVRPTVKAPNEPAPTWLAGDDHVEGERQDIGDPAARED
jgi:hypothetical protein